MAINLGLFRLPENIENASPIPGEALPFPGRRQRHIRRYRGRPMPVDLLSTWIDKLSNNLSYRGDVYNWESDPGEAFIFIKVFDEVIARYDIKARCIDKLLCPYVEGEVVVRTPFQEVISRNKFYNLTRYLWRNLTNLSPIRYKGITILKGATGKDLHPGDHYSIPEALRLKFIEYRESRIENRESRIENRDITIGAARDDYTLTLDLQAAAAPEIREGLDSIYQDWMRYVRSPSTATSTTTLTSIMSTSPIVSTSIYS